VSRRRRGPGRNGSCLQGGFDRCDGNRPACSSCLSLGFDCIYEPSESASNVIVRKDYVSDLEKRVTSVEQMLQRLNDVLKGHLAPCGNGIQNTNNNHNGREQAISCYSVTCSDSVVSAQPLPLSTSPVTGPGTRATGLEEPQDEDDSTNGIAMVFTEEKTSAFFGESSNVSFTRLLLQGIAAVHQDAARGLVLPGADRDSALGESINTSVISAGAARYKLHSEATLAADASPTALPSTIEMDTLLDIYFDTAGSVFPFICEETTRNTYHDLRRNGFTQARRTWLGTLNMMFAIASSFDKDYFPSAKKRFERSNVFYKRALELCSELSKRVISLEIVQFLLLVVIHCQGTQRSVQAWNSLGLATRSAMALGLHSEHTGLAISSGQEKYRRRTWVVMYCMDKVLSVAFGRPASIPDEQVPMVREVTMDHESASVKSGVSGGAAGGGDSQGNIPDIRGDFLTVSFRLYQIMSRSLREQYGANLENTSSNPDDIASLKASGGLRKTLQAWATGLPAHLRLFDPESGLLAQGTHINRFRVILTLRYHNLSILIHKPLLSATVRHLFLAEKVTAGGSPPYLLQLAMAEAHECVRSAQLTIDLVHGVIDADSSNKNNLGAWYFTLYYGIYPTLVFFQTSLSRPRD
jgi:hypothetical protein